MKALPYLPFATQSIEVLPDWILPYEKKIHEFLLRHDVSIEDTHSEIPDEYIKYDIHFNEYSIPMFMVLFKYEDVMYYQIDCAVFNLTRLEKRHIYEVQNLCMRDTWNLLHQYRAVISQENYLTINTVGKLDLISVEYFEYLINEIYPYSKYLHKKISLINFSEE